MPFYKKKFILFIVGITLILLMHTLFVYIMFDEVKLLRILLSIVLLSGMILTTFIFVHFLQTAKEVNIFKALKFLFYFMLILGYSSLFLINNNLVPGRSMIFFGEPSHYAMIFAPIALSYLYSLSIKHKLLNIIALLILSVLLKSLLLLISILLIIFLIFRYKHLIAIVTIVIIVFIFSPSSIYQHILERIDIFNIPIKDINLSARVYLSGAERAYLNLFYSSGLGVGFNNFGFIGPNGIFGTQMINIEGHLLGNRDGSFLASKLIGELGLIGIMLIITYIYYLFKVVVNFKSQEYNEVKSIICASFFITFSLYMFVRGMGYFTPVTFMMMSSTYWYYLNSSKKYI